MTYRVFEIRGASLQIHEVCDTGRPTVADFAFKSSKEDLSSKDMVLLVADGKPTQMAHGKKGEVA